MLHKIFALFFLFILFFNFTSFAANDNEVAPANKTQLSILLGSYDLNAPGKRITSIGSFTIGFTYRFFEKTSAIASYNNLMTLTNSLSSVVSGFDIGLTYCFWICTAMKQKISNVATVVSWSPWGLQVGAGFAQRSVMLQSLSVGYSGPFIKLEGNYMLGDRLKILGATQYTTMSNNNRTLSHTTFQLGVGFDFGDNIFNASSRPSQAQ